MTRDLIGIRVSIKIEMFKNMGLYNEVEKLKYGSIMFNIKDPKNPNLWRKILLGEVKLKRLIKITSKKMASDEGKCEIRKIKDKTTLREQMVDHENQVSFMMIHVKKAKGKTERALAFLCWFVW